MTSPHPTDHEMASPTDALNDVAYEALRVCERRYRRVFETAQDGILLLDAQTAQIKDVNPYLIQMLGYPQEEFLGKKLWDMRSFADVKESKEMFVALQNKGYVRYEDLPLRTAAGASIAVEFVGNAYDCEGIKVIQCNIRNITERRITELKLERHMQLYAALSHCNKAIVHCTSEEALFQKICHAAVQFGLVNVGAITMKLNSVLIARYCSRIRPWKIRKLSTRSSERPRSAPAS